VGSHVYVAGTVGRSEDGSIARDAYSQAKRAIEIIANALAEAGSALNDVVRTRTFVTDIAMFDDVARAHREAFGDVLPAATLVQVSRLVGDYLLEIEADAEVA
jgi:enamine deaminase RidA (YjgF/YER057c/UK114 family)